MNQQQVLVRSMNERRVREGLSLRKVALATGISASTLSRWETHADWLADSENVVRLARWLEVPQLEDRHSVVVSYEPNILAAICRVIRADRKLDPRDAESLCQIMTVFYNQVSSKV